MISQVLRNSGILGKLYCLLFCFEELMVLFCGQVDMVHNSFFKLVRSGFIFWYEDLSNYFGWFAA